MCFIWRHAFNLYCDHFKYFGMYSLWWILFPYNLVRWRRWCVKADSPSKNISLCYLLWLLAHFIINLLPSPTPTIISFYHLSSSYFIVLLESIQNGFTLFETFYKYIKKEPLTDLISTDFLYLPSNSLQCSLSTPEEHCSLTCTVLFECNPLPPSEPMSHFLFLKQALKIFHFCSV